MKPFAYTRATDPATAIQAVTREQAAKCIAGGTNLIDLMKEGVERPDRPVDVTRLEAQLIEERDGELRLGALAKNADTANHPLVRTRYPLFLALSTGFGVVASLGLGSLFDRIGLPVVLVAVFLSALFAPFVFLGSFYVALLGMLLWGIGYATQDTLLKALIASVLPEGRRNLAFGLFYLGYGGGWLVGSVTTGLLYEHSLPLLIAFSVAVQLASVTVFFAAQRRER